MEKRVLAEKPLAQAKPGGGSFSYKPSENQRERVPGPLSQALWDMPSSALTSRPGTLAPHTVGLLFLVLKAGPPWAFPGGARLSGGSLCRGSAWVPGHHLTRAVPLPRLTSAPGTTSAGPWQSKGPLSHSRRGERWVLATWGYFGWLSLSLLRLRKDRRGARILGADVDPTFSGKSPETPRAHLLAGRPLPTLVHPSVRRWGVHSAEGARDSVHPWPCPSGWVFSALHACCRACAVHPACRPAVLQCSHSQQRPVT